MTKQAHLARQRLAETSDRLVREVAAGDWNHLSEIHGAPVGQWPKVIRSLVSFCPGFSQLEYQQALSRSLRDNR